MENAAQALIIAGAILLAILIIAIGMLVYNNARSAITDSLSSMSESEIQAFNSKFENYEGNASGAQIKSLIGDIITNSKTYIEETPKIVEIKFDKVSSKMDEKVVNRPEEPNNTTEYVTELGAIRNAIENKHTYWVDTVFNTAGLVDSILISYDPASPQAHELITDEK